MVKSYAVFTLGQLKTLLLSYGGTFLYARRYCNQYEGALSSQYCLPAGASKRQVADRVDRLGVCVLCIRISSEVNIVLHANPF